MIARLVRRAWRRRPRLRLRVAWIGGWHWTRRRDLEWAGWAYRRWLGPVLVTVVVEREAWVPPAERVSEQWLGQQMRREEPPG